MRAYDSASRAADAAGAVTLGRSEACDIVLPHPLVSRRHIVARAFNGVKAAVAAGRITEARLDQSVRQVLRAKARASPLPSRAWFLVAHRRQVAVRHRRDKPFRSGNSGAPRNSI